MYPIGKVWLNVCSQADEYHNRKDGKKRKKTENTEKTEKTYLADRYILWKNIVFSVFSVFSVIDTSIKP